MIAESTKSGDLVYWIDDDSRTPTHVRIRQSMFIRREDDKCLIQVFDSGGYNFLVPETMLFNSYKVFVS